MGVFKLVPGITLFLETVHVSASGAVELSFLHQETSEIHVVSLPESPAPALMYQTEYARLLTAIGTIKRSRLTAESAPDYLIVLNEEYSSNYDHPLKGLRFTAIQVSEGRLSSGLHARKADRYAQ